MTNPTIPINTRKALRHFNMIEDDKTPLLRVFCFTSDTAPLASIKKAFRRLAAMVHPDRCKDDPRGATRSMMTISSAMEIVKSEVQYKRWKRGLAKDAEFILDLSVKYSVAETDSECALREKEAKESAQSSHAQQNPSTDRDRYEEAENEDVARENAEQERVARENAEQERAAREDAERERAERIRKLRENSERDHQHSASDPKDPPYYPSDYDLSGSDEDDNNLSNDDINLSDYIVPDGLMEEPPIIFRGDSGKDFTDRGDVVEDDQNEGESRAGPETSGTSVSRGRKNYRTASQIRRTKNQKPNVAASYCQYGRKIAAADAAHCDGVGPQSYGTTFEVVTYDTNMHLLPLLFAHFIGPQSHTTWKTVFEECKSIPGFDVPGRTTIVDQEKSIDKAYKGIFENAKLFLDPLHVRKNMGMKLGASKAIGLSLYERALYTPSRASVDEIVRQYTSAQKEYLAKFDRSELYKAYSNLEDTIVTSQGAEGQMGASLRNHIRSVEPQKMLEKVVNVQRTGFLKQKSAADASKSSVPPNIEKLIAKRIRRARVYQDTVKFCDGTEGREATVTSCTDGSIERRVRLIGHQTPPLCCGYSQNNDEFPCFHGVAVLCEKHGAANIHRYVATRHLSKEWPKAYNQTAFQIPSQAEVDEVVSKAKLLVLSGDNLEILKALPPPRGRPVKNAGVRRKVWFERGPEAKKRRSYTCSLCHQEGHTSSQCQLRQLFGDMP